MVYDEGFEIFFGEKSTPNFASYFVFLKFVYSGEYENKKKYKSKCFESMVGWFHIGSNHWGCFKGHKDVNHFWEITNTEVSNKDIVLQSGMSKSFLEEDLNVGIQPQKNTNMESEKVKLELEENNKTNSFLELSLNSRTISQNEIVEKINSMNLTWKAAEYEELEGYSLGEVSELFRKTKTDNEFKFQLTKKSSNFILFTKKKLFFF